VERIVVDLYFDLSRESDVEWIVRSVRGVGGAIKHDLVVGISAHCVDTTLRDLKGH